MSNGEQDLDALLGDIKPEVVVENIVAAKGQYVKLKGAEDYVHYKEVEGLSWVNDTIFVTIKGIPTNTVSQAQNVYGDSVELFEIRRLMDMPLEEEEKEALVGEFRSVPYKIGSTGMIKRVDEYDLKTYKEIFFGNNQTQYMRAVAKLKELLGDKFLQFTLEQEQDKFQKYLSGRHFGESPGPKQIKNATRLLKQRGVDVTKFGNQTTAEDLSSFDFRELYASGDAEHVLDALKRVKKTSKRFIEYGQEFLNVLKQRQRTGVKDTFKIAFNHAREISGDKSQEMELRINYTAECKALMDKRAGRVVAETYKNEEDFAARVNKTFAEMQNAAESTLTPLQLLVNYTFDADRFQSIDAHLGSTEESTLVSRRKGSRDTNVFHSKGYGIKLNGDKESTEVIMQQRIDVEDNIELKLKLFEDAFNYTKIAKENLGTESPGIYFADNTLELYKGALILSNVVVTEWTRDFFNKLNQYRKDNKDKLLPGRSDASYSTAEQNLELLGILFDEGIIGKANFSKKANEFYQQKIQEAELESAGGND